MRRGWERHGGIRGRRREGRGRTDVGMGGWRPMKMRRKRKGGVGRRERAGERR
jgi:hypothetical protein